jgi:hypothetical protein
MLAPASDCAANNPHFPVRTMRAQMLPAERFDILVLGRGKGGELLAWSLARSGISVAVVERPWGRRLLPSRRLFAS